MTARRERRAATGTTGDEENRPQPSAMPASRTSSSTSSQASRASSFAHRKNYGMGLQRMDNVGIVGEPLDARVAFFTELGLELEGRTMIEGEWSGRVTGLRGQRVEIAMMRMPNGEGRSDARRFL